MKPFLRSLVREPLVQFAVLGAVLWGALALRPREKAPPPEAIVVTAGQIEHLAALWTRTWQRPPTRRELEGLVDDHMREEAAYRAGVEAGLDRNDVVVRRRIRQKLEFMAEDVAAQVEPSDADLASYLAAHADAFRVEPRASFRQVFLDPDARGAALEADAAALLERLRADPGLDAAALGDRILVEHAHAGMSEREVASVFGPAFAAHVLALEPGSWHGPVASGYGVHLVIVDERRPGRLPALDEVRDEVVREWQSARRLEALAAFYDALVRRHEVVIEWPEPGGDDGPA